MPACKTDIKPYMMMMMMMMKFKRFPFLKYFARLTHTGHLVECRKKKKNSTEIFIKKCRNSAEKRSKVRK